MRQEKARRAPDTGELRGDAVDVWGVWAELEGKYGNDFVSKKLGLLKEANLAGEVVFWPMRFPSL